MFKNVELREKIGPGKEIAGVRGCRCQAFTLPGAVDSVAEQIPGVAS